MPTLSHQPRFKGTERGGTTVTANSPSSRLFTRLKCAKSRFCSRGLRREHPTAFQRRARSAAIPQSPLWWLRSFSIEANERKNSQKEKNNPSRRLQSEPSSGNAESFWKSPPPPRSARGTGPGRAAGAGGPSGHCPAACGVCSNTGFVRAKPRGCLQPRSFPSLAGE